MMCSLLTCVDEATRCSLAKLFRFIRQCDLHDPGNVARGCLDADSVRRDQLKEQHRNCVTQQQQMIPPTPCKYLG